jgi:hypothetical protein
MIIVIQCAAGKHEEAGRLQTVSGKPVEFVASPKLAPPDSTRLYARPDDLADPGVSWRQALLNYNSGNNGNPLGLYSAYRLYQNKIYERLAERFGVENVYILSAGWGLIRTDFLTPYYDITFSQSADDYKRRRKPDRYADFCMLPAPAGDDIVFFGGKDYLPLFSALTAAVKTRKIVFYNSGTAPQISGCVLRRFETTTRTNWHYECAKAFFDGVLRVS